MDDLASARVGGGREPLRTESNKMSRAFPANNPGNPPAPFRSFPAGVIVFYLVALLEALTGTPRPSGQLQVESETESDACGRLRPAARNGRRYKCQMVRDHNGDCGFSRRTVTETVTERAMRYTPGQRAVQVAKRTYTFAKYTSGAKGRAAEAAVWTDRQGNTLRIWGHLVTVDGAEALGFTVPGGRTIARPGRRGQAFENGRQATIRGGNVAPVAPVTPPVAPVAPPVVDPSVSGGRNLPSWARSMARQPDAIAARERAQAARQANLDAIAAREAAEAAERNAPAAETTDAGVERFRRLILDSDPTPVKASSDGWEGVERFKRLDLD
jgi:RNase P/RNase MRP subunit p29